MYALLFALCSPLCQPKVFRYNIETRVTFGTSKMLTKQEVTINDIYALALFSQSGIMRLV